MATGGAVTCSVWEQREGLSRGHTQSIISGVWSTSSNIHAQWGGRGASWDHLCAMILSSVPGSVVCKPTFLTLLRKLRARPHPFNELARDDSYCLQLRTLMNAASIPKGLRKMTKQNIPEAQSESKQAWWPAEQGWRASTSPQKSQALLHSWWHF